MPANNISRKTLCKHAQQIHMYTYKYLDYKNQIDVAGKHMVTHVFILWNYSNFVLL